MRTNQKRYTQTELQEMGWDALDRADLLPYLKENFPDTYKGMFFQKFGKYPNPPGWTKKGK